MTRNDTDPTLPPAGGPSDSAPGNAAPELAAAPAFVAGAGGPTGPVPAMPEASDEAATPTAPRSAEEDEDDDDEDDAEEEALAAAESEPAAPLHVEDEVGPLDEERAEADDATAAPSPEELAAQAELEAAIEAEAAAPAVPSRGEELVAPATMPTGEPAEIDPRKLDQDALKVVLRLQHHGFEAYLVGGCVRDLMVGRTPKDFDIATSAHPEDVRDTFRNCRLIGRRFRLAHVYFKGGKIVEVSTFRANPTELVAPPEEGEEGEDLLITHDNVFGTAVEDARRRDFTVNGLFYDVSEGRVIDYVRGRRDLKEQLIRTIGDPEVRMREDPVRILRAVRFACKLGFDIESRTYAAMEGAVEDLPRCAPARLLEETFRLIRGGIAAPALRLICALDAMRVLLPPVHAHLREHGPEGEKTFFGFAEALDRKVSATQGALDDAFLLAALLVPVARAAPAPEGDEGPGAGVSHAIEELLAELVRSARLPRRIADRTRLLLIMQRTLSGEKRRRGNLNSFKRHPLFQEALGIYEITVEATGEGRERLEQWRAGEPPPPAAGAAGAEGGASGGSGGAGERKRRRRRRGGRRHGSGEGGGGGGEA